MWGGGPLLQQPARRAPFRLLTRISCENVPRACLGCSVDGLEVTFRGRVLKGKHFDLPKGKAGLVLRTVDAANKEAGKRFDGVTVWNYGPHAPSETDRVPRLMQWFDVAHAIHDD